MQKLDILAIAAHPDDVELSASGTVIKHIRIGYKVGLLDLTQGELGTRGNATIRKEEALDAADILGAHERIQLKMPDGFFENNMQNQIEIIKVLRTCQPEIVLANAIDDRHPDHPRAAKLVHEACFLSGLKKIETFDDEGNEQEPWRPNMQFNYIQDYFIQPHLIIDISNYMDQKLEAIQAYKSQFFNPASKEPDTPISTESFIEFIIARARQMGRLIGAEYGEGFTVSRPVGVTDLLDLI